ncbi:MAG: hypothetical protein WCI51_09230 [Lentisphaerota bacterium]
MKHFGKIALMILAAWLCAGCATISSKKPDYDISITSSPDDAEYLVTDGSGKILHSGKTPATVHLRSSQGYFDKAKYIIEVKKIGYYSQKVILEANVNSSYYCNSVVGFLIVDPLSGAMWELKNPPHFNLDRASTVKTNENPQISQDDTGKTNGNTVALTAHTDEKPISQDKLNKKSIENNHKKDSGSKEDEYFF